MLTALKELLTRHKQLIAIYLENNYYLFFDRYNAHLVQSSSYVTKRQSIKLLGEILLDRANYSTMTRYVESGEHLKICMTLLKDDRKMVQYEGFHVFKVNGVYRLSLCYFPALISPGFRGEPQQITTCREDTGEQSRETASLSAYFPGRPDRG